MIRIEHLTFSVGTFAISDVSLHVAAGEYFVLLGPTGSGKTLLVECLCGLNRIASGRILLGGSDVTRLEPRLRGLGYLPQDYALFPHMTVRRNIAFGLHNRPVPAALSRPRVDDLMERLGVAHLADRLPAKLSGGEKQRVALARALAVGPQVLLLDEPVSALDESTRDGLCRLLKQLQRDTQTTTIHVCHNFAEMLAVADRVGIIHQGRILQVGTPQEILQHPRDTLVARFVQAGNLFSARAHSEGSWVRLECSDAIELCAARQDCACADGEVTVMVRPENIRLGSVRPQNPPPHTTILEGSLTDVVDLGPVVKVQVACRGAVEFLVTLGKREYSDLRLAPRQQVFLAIAAEDVHVMKKD